MGIINVLPGLMVASVFGVIDSIAGWALAEVVATRIGYSYRKGLVAAYVVGCTLQSAPYTLPIYLSAAQYLSECQEILRLTDEDHGAVRRDALGSHVRRNSCPYGGDEPCRCVRLAKDHEEAFCEGGDCLRDASQQVERWDRIAPWLLITQRASGLSSPYD